MVFACPRTFGWIGVPYTPIIQRLRRLEVCTFTLKFWLWVVVPHDRFHPRRSSLLPNGAFPIGGRGWRVVLSFQTLCDLYLPDACQIEDFFTLYTMMNTKENAYFFGVKSGWERLIINLVDRDQGWLDTIIRISSAWETAQQR